MVRRLPDRRIQFGGVETEHDEFHTLQTHHPISFGPAPVIANAHSHDAAEGAPNRPAEVSHLVIALLEMLKWPLGVIFGMAGKVDLAIFTDYVAVAVGQDSGVVMVPLAILYRELGITQVEANAQSAGLFKKRLSRRIGHLEFEKCVHLRLVGH